MPPSRYLALTLALLAACAEHPTASPTASESIALAKVTEGTGSIQIVQGGTGTGTITSRPAGIDCTLGGDEGPTGTCEATFPAGTRVKLSADEAEGSTFEGWAPVTSCRKAPNVVIVADAVISCQPVFEKEPGSEFFIGVRTEGSGRVTSSPEGIDCTSDADAGTVTGTCAAVYDAATIITLTASPALGWMFVAFGGENPDCADGVITLSAATQCTATFVRTSE